MRRSQNCCKCKTHTFISVQFVHVNAHRDDNWTFWWSLLNSEIHLTLYTLCHKWNGVKSFHSLGFFFLQRAISQNDAIFDSTSSLYTLLRQTSSFFFFFLGGVQHPHYILDYIKPRNPQSFIWQSDQSRTLVCFTECWAVGHLHLLLVMCFIFLCSCVYLDLCLPFPKNVPGSIFSLCWFIIAPWTSVQKDWEVFRTACLIFTTYYTFQNTDMSIDLAQLLWLQNSTQSHLKIYYLNFIGEFKSSGIWEF